MQSETVTIDNDNDIQEILAVNTGERFSELQNHLSRHKEMLVPSLEYPVVSFCLMCLRF